jgi:hypothetical protein
MIELGDPSMPSGGYTTYPCPTGTPRICHGVAVEGLTLNGSAATTVNGIVNTNSQELSYVSHVNMQDVVGTGLYVSGNAENSGPYEDITYNTARSGGSGSVCAQIKGLSATRGIHGLSCTSPPDSPTAVLLDSSNNTLEDVRIMGFSDGILVGSQAAAHSNVLRNIVGDTSTGGLLPPVYVVDISATSNNVSDLAIVGVNNVLAAPLNGEYTIRDLLTGTTLSDAYVAMYALGEGASPGYSRFTTSPSTATWAVGTANLSGTPSCAAPGSIYSNTSGSGTALWVCSVGTSNVWTPIQ